MQINRIYSTLLLLSIILVVSMAFIPFPKESAIPVYQDDFEKYTSDHNIQKAYIVWEDGATLKARLQKNLAHSGKQSLLVEIVSPHPTNNSINGSIYHVVPLLQRNWSRATGIRFWVANSTIKPLLLSLNFKEEYNEYWAISGNGKFYLQSEEGTLRQQNIEYGNLPIPAAFVGFVIVPFSNFAVPDWNTARGNKQMDLKRIESYAFAVNISDDFPRSFWIDDFEVLAQGDYLTLFIQGSPQIQIPTSGEHREQYAAHIHSSATNTSIEVKAAWAVTKPADSAVRIDEVGGLFIPSGTKSSQVILTAIYSALNITIKDEFTVKLAGSEHQSPTPGTQQMPVEATPAAYERFSTSFETWAVVNRPLFVSLIIAALIIILILLSLFQRRMK